VATDRLQQRWPPWWANHFTFGLLPITHLIRIESFYSLVLWVIKTKLTVWGQCYGISFRKKLIPLLENQIFGLIFCKAAEFWAQIANFIVEVILKCTTLAPWSRCFPARVTRLG
jgi:hypothetical protein